MSRTRYRDEAGEFSVFVTFSHTDFTLEMANAGEEGIEVSDTLFVLYLLTFIQLLYRSGTDNETETNGTVWHVVKFTLHWPTSRNHIAHLELQTPHLTPPGIALICSNLCSCFANGLIRYDEFWEY